MHIRKITQIDDSLSITLPEDVANKLGAKSGQPMYILDTPDGVLISPYEESTRDQIGAGREVLRDYDETFQVLKK